MRHVIENEYLRAEVESLGSELRSLVKKEDGSEMIWEADPAYWGGTSPLLFPFIGKTRDFKYSYKGRIYNSVKHGFALRTEFQAVCQEKDRVVLAITDTPETYENYPFHFRLEVEHRLEGRDLVVEWRVHNLGDETMYFSIGGHPAFACPPKYDKNAVNRTSCSIRLVGAEDRETVDNLCVGSDGTLNGEISLVEVKNGMIAVTENIFELDALLIPRQDITAVGFCDSQGKEFVRVESNTPVWGVWSVPDSAASYICIEPWFGLCDNAEYEGTLEDRPLTNHAEAGETWTEGFRICTFE